MSSVSTLGGGGIMSKSRRLLANVWLLLRLLLKDRRFVRRILIAAGVSASLVLLAIKFACHLRSRRRRQRQLQKQINNNNNQTVSPHVAAKASQKSPTLNRQFFAELRYLTGIMFPRLLSKQTLLLAMHTSTLVSRTFLSIYIAQLEGLLVRNIVAKKFAAFVKCLAQWLLIAIPATTCNSLIRYLESRLDAELKSQLVHKSLDIYFRDRVYYRIAVRHADSTGAQVDQNLTDDIDKLTHLVVHLYSQLTKPLLDITLITVSLIRLAARNEIGSHITVALTATAFALIAGTGLIMRQVSPGFGRMSADVAKQRGQLRYLYTRIQPNSEEIAFFCGERNEARLIHTNYERLKRMLERVNLNRLWYVILEQFLLKYVWSAGMSFVSYVMMNPILDR